MKVAESAPNPVSWTNMSNGVEKVRQRLLKATGTLAAAGIDYAVIGGNAVAAWVSRVDDSVVRNTRDVDLLVRREDMPRIIAAMEAAGFKHRTVSILGGKGRIEMFLDGPGAKARDAVHLIFACEKVSPDSLEASPPVDAIDAQTEEFRLLDLAALVTMKLTSYRRKDQVHLLDMIEIGQLDASWLDRVPRALRDRLQALLDDPDG
ncbi:MAG: nucleotidyltransferase family protein [Verrucomicrobia bacterium]|nr:nucleotidyltransferase family protein [Verrucomicrobiota bacterium]